MSKERSLHRVVLADDHAVVREGVKNVLAELGSTEIVAETADGLSAIAAVKQHQPDLLVLDSAMPHAKGIEVFAEARRWSKETSVVLLTGFTSAGVLATWLDAEVEGILLKSCNPSEMRTCFETVLEGGRYFAEDALTILEEATNTVALTNREREVLSLLAMGYQNGGIGERLSISPRTVEKHRASLMEKIGVGSLAELIAYALREGLISEQTQL
ncbi:MAG: response regulator transcription factor [Hyphomonas sp.]|nr:response regulator transcription factor [Hyphomonas sp.]